MPSANSDPNVDILHAIDGVSSNDLWAVGQQARSEPVTGVAPGTAHACAERLERHTLVRRGDAERGR